MTMTWMDGAVAHRISRQFGEDIDGLYYYRAKEGDGIYSAQALRDVARLLDWVNQPWRDWLASGGIVI